MLCRRESMSGVVSNLPTKNAERPNQHPLALVKCATIIARATSKSAHLHRSLDQVSGLTVLLGRPRAGGADIKTSERTTLGSCSGATHHFRPEPSVRRVIVRAIGRARIDGLHARRGPVLDGNALMRGP